MDSGSAFLKFHTEFHWQQLCCISHSNGKTIAENLSLCGSLKELMIICSVMNKC